MKIKMVHKARSIEQYLHEAGEKVEVKIEKRITLDRAEFVKFSDDFMGDYEFLKANADICGETEKGERRCIRIDSEDVSYSIVVDLDGYTWARYAGIIKRAR